MLVDLNKFKFVDKTLKVDILIIYYSSRMEHEVWRHCVWKDHSNSIGSIWQAAYCGHAFVASLSIVQVMRTSVLELTDLLQY